MNKIENLKPTKYRFMIAEDDPYLRKTYTQRFYQISKKRLIPIEIHEASFGEQSIRLLEKYVFQFSSFDQSMPFSKDENEVHEDIGFNIAKNSLNYSPFILGRIFTAFPNHVFSGDITELGLRYYDKENYSPQTYAEMFLSDIVKFERFAIWEMAAEKLPHCLAEFAYRILRNSDHERKLQQSIPLWETGIRLKFILLLCICSHLNIEINLKGNNILKNGRFDNGAVSFATNKIFHEIIEHLSGNSYGSISLELNRFWGDEYLHNALHNMQLIRNYVAHSTKIGSGALRGLFLEQITNIVQSIISFSFWARHPIVHDISIVPVGAVNRMKYTVCSREGEKRPGNTVSVRSDILSKIVIDPKKPYQFFNRLDNVESPPFIVPLYPLLRLEYNNEGIPSIWIADNPKLNTYNNPLTDLKKKFNDSDLSDWWAENLNNQIF